MPGLSAPAGATLVPVGFGPWRCKRISLSEDGGEIGISFERQGATDWVEIRVFQASQGKRVFKKFEHCAVAYRGSLSDKTPEVRAQLAALVMAIGTALDVRLEQNPGASIAEALGRHGEQRALVFGRDTLLSLLAPDIVLGRELFEGWRLADVYPTSHLRETAQSELVLVLDFQRDADGRRMLFEVARRADVRPALITTPNFSVSYLSLGASTPDGGDQLMALVSFVLQLRDHPGLKLTFPDLLSDVSHLLPAAEEPAPAASDRVLNLAINSDCGQACNFCSVLQLSPPTDGDDRTYARLRADLESNRKAGVTSVRVNGYDPLAYSRILDVARLITELGYEHADVFSPCTRLADPTFCEELLRELPASRRIYVPVYGGSAEVHDRVVGTPGAFERVGQAIANMKKSLGAGEIVLLAVATRDNLEGLLAAASWAGELGLSFSAHMPYPSSESRADRFFNSVPRQAAVADVVARAFERGTRFQVNGVAPCILMRAMREHGIRLGQWLQSEDTSHPLPGTEYREERFVHRAREAGHSAFHAASVPCPHVAACALSAACPREILRSYLEACGAGEFAPVGIAELVHAAGTR